MARNDGTAAHAVDETLEELREAPHSFDFFQALRLLECLFPDEPRYGHSIRLSEDRVRLTQEPSLSFAPSSLYSFGQKKDSKFYELSVRFFGLCGPNGALPLHLTEYVRDRIRHHDDDTLASFSKRVSSSDAFTFLSRLGRRQPGGAFRSPRNRSLLSLRRLVDRHRNADIEISRPFPGSRQTFLFRNLRLPVSTSRRIAKNDRRLFPSSLSHRRVRRPVGRTPRPVPIPTR